MEQHFAAARHSLLVLIEAYENVKKHRSTLWTGSASLDHALSRAFDTSENVSLSWALLNAHVDSSTLKPVYLCKLSPPQSLLTRLMTGHARTWYGTVTQPRNVPSASLAVS